MQLEFTKMHGLGNDFVVIDAIHQPFNPSPEICRQIADRRFGVGCDQLLLVEPPRQSETQFHYRIFNSDGSEVEQCGNGARCFARFVWDQGLAQGDSLVVGTAAGVIRLYREGGEGVRVNMGPPELEPGRIPFIAEQQSLLYPLEVKGETRMIAAVSMGNPHAVLKVADLDSAPVAQWGPEIESHPRFPQRVNVGFMQCLDARHIRLRVYERGAGETLACGTGACAAVVAGRLQGLLEAQVRVSLPGGELDIQWDGGQAPVWMTGPAVSVFTGRLAI